jgi:hypothetical protein
VAAGLSEVLPEGFVASPTADGVWLHTPDHLGNLGWAGHIEQDPGNPEAFRDAAWNVLNSLQDGVCLTLREFWPMARDEPEHQMAMPGARLDGSTLHMWYGDEQAPTVRLRSLDLEGD